MFCFLWDQVCLLTSNIPDNVTCFRCQSEVQKGCSKFLSCPLSGSMPISSICLIYGTIQPIRGRRTMRLFQVQRSMSRSLCRANVVGWLHMWHSYSSRGDNDGKKHCSSWIGITTCCSFYEKYLVLLRDFDSYTTSSKALKSHRREYPCCRMN